MPFCRNEHMAESHQPSVWHSQVSAKGILFLSLLCLQSEFSLTLGWLGSLSWLDFARTVMEEAAPSCGMTIHHTSTTTFLILVPVGRFVDFALQQLFSCGKYSTMQLFCLMLFENESLFFGIRTACTCTQNKETWASGNETLAISTAKHMTMGQIWASCARLTKVWIWFLFLMNKSEGQLYSWKPHGKEERKRVRERERGRQRWRARDWRKSEWVNE